VRASLAGVSVVAAFGLAAAGNTWAAEKNPHDRGGPVIYLNRHGAPTNCTVAVSGVNKDGSDYRGQIYRKSCDGTLWMPELQLNSSLKIALHAQYPSEHNAVAEVTIKNKRDDAKSYVTNDTAICFLAKSQGNFVYTNMSDKGGDCNGKVAARS
jgi:hypothetical protein